jgi:hypothetical protein
MYDYKNNTTKHCKLQFKNYKWRSVKEASNII